ncbi:MAG: hypothetical protein EP330_26505 [Deltaproteobacteria bacterium]|nr:MAG: hypothetical protein EP330_26505 [Deltaproteobacteria bacterium]
MIDRLDLEFRSLDSRDQGLVFGTLLAAALFCIHFLLYSTWFVEDAAISFGFARHVADGWGFVTYPGGERVEGFSNPTWTLALAGFSLIGISPFVASKLFGAACGLGALMLSAVWARELIDEERRHYALIAPFVLATTPSFVMWCASGLENPLLSLLVAGAAVVGLAEVRTRTLPVSGLLWAMVAMTRPEAPLYAAIGGLVTGAGVLRSQGVAGAARYTAGWLALFFVPFGLWHTWRYSYFAWEFPNTYYAKLASDENDFQPWGWDVKGWRYLRGWALETGQGFLAPLYVVGQSGVRDHRGAVGALIASLALLLVLPGVEWFQILPLTPDSEPEWLIHGRVVFLAGVVAVAPWLGLGRRSDDARALAWYLLAAALFFGLYSGGDWMAGYRWPSLMVVPMAVLLADAVADVGEVLDEVGNKWVLRLGLAMTVGLTAVLGAVQSGRLITGPETSPYDVFVRVRHMQHVADVIGIERPSAGEIDMGAHVWWSDFELVDLAGLLDVPVGHHAWQPPFVTEYVLRERRPDFMHIHSYWGRKTKIASHAGFFNHWVEVPAYPTGPYNQHPGNHVRRDLLFREQWDGPSRDLWLGSAVELVALEVLSESTAPGGEVVVRLATREPRPHADSRLTLFLFADGEVLTSADAPILWDWVEPTDYVASEVAVTRLRIPIPADAAPGTYGLGLAAWTDGRRAVPLTAGLPAAQDPVFSRHELHLDEVVIAPEDEVRARVEARLAAIGAHAEADRCVEADAEAMGVRDMRRGLDESWESAVRAHDASRARCWARLAEAKLDVDAMHHALRLDPGESEVLAAGHRMAETFQAKASEARSAGDLDGAYAALRDALICDPTRSWTRRHAETLRDQRLGL